MSADTITRQPTLRELVAEEVRAMMARRRLTGRELARRTGKSQTFWSRRMTGEVAFDMDDLETVASYLDVPVTRLLVVEGVTSGQPIGRYGDIAGRGFWDLAA